MYAELGLGDMRRELPRRHELSCGLRVRRRCTKLMAGNDSTAECDLPEITVAVQIRESIGPTRGLLAGD